MIGNPATYRLFSVKAGVSDIFGRLTYVILQRWRLQRQPARLRSSTELNRGLADQSSSD